MHIRRHEVIPKCGSFGVRYSDGRPSQYFYWKDLPGRRLRQDLLTSRQGHCRSECLSSVYGPVTLRCRGTRPLSESMI